MICSSQGPLPIKHNKYKGANIRALNTIRNRSPSN